MRITLELSAHWSEKLSHLTHLSGEERRTVVEALYRLTDIPCGIQRNLQFGLGSDSLEDLLNTLMQLPIEESIVSVNPLILDIVLLVKDLECTVPEDISFINADTTEPIVDLMVCLSKYAGGYYTTQELNLALNNAHELHGGMTFSLAATYFKDTGDIRGYTTKAGFRFNKLAGLIVDKYLTKKDKHFNLTRDVDGKYIIPKSKCGVPRFNFGTYKIILNSVSNQFELLDGDNVTLNKSSVFKRLKTGSHDYTCSLAVLGLIYEASNSMQEMWNAILNNLVTGSFNKFLSDCGDALGFDAFPIERILRAIRVNSGEPTNNFLADIIADERVVSSLYLGNNSLSIYDVESNNTYSVTLPSYAYVDLHSYVWLLRVKAKVSLVNGTYYVNGKTVTNSHIVGNTLDRTAYCINEESVALIKVLNEELM